MAASKPKIKILAVVGSTASGKTALSIALAKALCGEVVSCRKSNTVALVGGDNVLLSNAVLTHKEVAQGSELRIGHTCEKFKFFKNFCSHNYLTARQLK